LYVDGAGRAKRNLVLKSHSIAILIRFPRTQATHDWHGVEIDNSTGRVTQHAKDQIEDKVGLPQPNTQL
jgi:hypothetical protein